MNLVDDDEFAGLRPQKDDRIFETPLIHWALHIEIQGCVAECRSDMSGQGGLFDLAWAEQDHAGQVGDAVLDERYGYVVR